MLFSVIIPTYNRLELLQQTLESVWAQTFTNYEVIVVDDGSTDGTLAYLASLGSKIKTLIQTNSGPGAARNAGAKAASGEYLAFLDSDDLWLPWTLTTVAAVVARHARPSIIGGSLLSFFDEDQLPDAPAACHFDSFPDYYAGGRRGYFVGSNMAVILRLAFVDVGGFHTLRMNAEDHDLILRMGQLAGFVQIISPVTIGWRKHKGSETHNVGLSYDGVRYLIEQEKKGRYPGGSARKADRRQIISQHVRSLAVDCLRSRLKQEALALYASSLLWQVAAGRFKFVFGLPIKALMGAIRA